MVGYEHTANVASRLKEAMHNAGKTQADLSRETGISKATLSRYLSGQFEPKQIAVNKLAVSLNVSEMWLWGCDVPMERPTPDELGELAADVLLNPDVLHLAKVYMELEAADKEMVMMLVENLHQKTKKG